MMITNKVNATLTINGLNAKLSSVNLIAGITKISATLTQIAEGYPLYDADNERLMDVNGNELYSHALGRPLNVTLTTGGTI